MSLSVLALAGSLALEVTVAEPPERLHPVAWFGSLLARVDTARSRPRVTGTVIAVVAPLLAACLVAGVVLAAGRFDPLLAAGVGALVVFVSTSLRRLLDRAREVAVLSGEDLGRARARLHTLAGRDATDLSAGQVRSGAVESLAENLADGLVAPLCAYTLAVVVLAAGGSGPVLALAGGCASAAWIKAVNTLDSMFGYRTEPVGWCPARLDDLVMWIPARVTALLLVAVTGRPGSVRAAGGWVGGVPSPNSGWPMGTLAAALDVRLEKPGSYVLNPGRSLPDVPATRRALRQVAVAGLLAYLLAGVLTWS